MRTANGEAPAAATAEGFGKDGIAGTVDSRAAPLAGQALQVIEGEAKAREFLCRLRAEQADAQELSGERPVCPP